MANRQDRALDLPDPPAKPQLLTGAPSAELALCYRMERRLEVRCARCDKAFQAQRASARFCSNACRQLAYLRRRYPPGESGPFTLTDLERLIWRPTPPVRD
jgi:hypothetical protein